MANLTDSLNDLMSLEGALCAAVVDYNSGMMLASAGTGVDMERQLPVTPKWCAPR